MAISNQQNINIGLPNESANSDSLYAAFNKIQNNFNTLFACASPYNTFTPGNGVSIVQNTNTGVVTVTNTGVINLVAGTNIVLGEKDANGNVQISAQLSGVGSGTVTSINVVGGGGNARITSSGGPITSSGVITLDLATSGVVPGTYVYPSVTVDSYGRITSIASGASVGTVTSVGLVPGPGIQITNSPVTTTGNITVINTGVTQLNAGTGISLSSNTGEVTISSPFNGTVTSVNITSSTLSVIGGPIVTNGSISVDITNETDITANSINVTTATSNLLYLPSVDQVTNADALSLTTTASYFDTTSAWTSTLAPGTEGQIKTIIMSSDGGDMVVTVDNAGWKSSGTGTITFDSIGDACTLQYINNKWYCIGNNGVTFG